MVAEPSAALVAEITLRTLGVCLPALGISLAIGLPIGIALGHRHFAGRGATITLVNAGMGAPPVVVGLCVALLLWRTGPLGSLGLMYSPRAMILAQVVIVLPLIIGITLASSAALDPEWDLQVRALGIPSWRRLLLRVRELRLGLLAAVVAALGGILSEVGASQMVGGNLEGETRVLTTAIEMYTQMGRFEIAISLAAVLVGLMLLLAGLLTAVQLTGQR
ncbi:MAG: ABC transporter permease [Myxococcota bacterium]